MLITYFNCAKCDNPFDCKDGMPHTPVAGTLECATCRPKTATSWGLIKFLDQPGFTKTKDGYVSDGPLVLPKCGECKTTLLSATNPSLLNCGHLLCDRCDKRKNCIECGNEITKRFFFTAVMKFIDGLAEETLTRRTDATETLRKCLDCAIEQPVERTFSCSDCTKLVCGVCCVNRHRDHSVSPLLGIELTKLKANTLHRHDEKLNGLHKNLTFLHQEVEKSITRVISIGHKRLNEIEAQQKFAAARDIAADVEVASGEFEHHCEDYIPAARIFNEKLTQLAELLEGAKIN